jgi:hypothetical protein
MEEGWSKEGATLAIHLLRGRPEDRREEGLECLLALGRSLSAFTAREQKREADTRRTEDGPLDSVW